MVEKEYYIHRKGILKPTPMSFATFKKCLLYIYQELENDLYFQEATGYHCVDAGDIRGSWGTDIEAFIYLKLKMENIWPIQKNIESFSEATLFTVIEFLFDYVSEPINKSYHSWNNCGWHCSQFDKNKGQKVYRMKINELLKDYKQGYELSNEGIINELAPTGLETIFDEIVQTGDADNIDSRMKNAIAKYRKYGATIDDKKDAVRTLADVLEFLRKEGDKLPSKDDEDLFRIINRFDIRHHNRSQQSEYDKDVWYDWFFYTFLASISVLLKAKNIQK